MRTLLIGYDLDKPGQDYPGLMDAIKDCPSWWHCLDSTWIVRTEETTMQLRDRLKPRIDRNDKLLVVDVTGQVAAWVGFQERCSQWLKDNLPKRA